MSRSDVNLPVVIYFQILSVPLSGVFFRSLVGKEEHRLLGDPYFLFYKFFIAIIRIYLSMEKTC